MQARGIVVTAAFVWGCVVIASIIAATTPRPGVFLGSIDQAQDFMTINAFGLIPAVIALVALFFVPRPRSLGVKIAGIAPLAIVLLAAVSLVLLVYLSRMSAGA